MHPPEITNVCQKRDAIIKTTPNCQTSNSQNASPFLVQAPASGSFPARSLLRYVAEHLLDSWSPIKWESRKPFNLRDRLFEFGLLTIRLVQFLHTRGPVGVAVSNQILRAGTSAGASYEEADDGSSDRDSIAKKKIVLREGKECRWRMRLIRAAGILTAAQDPDIKESDELVRILATVIRNAEGREKH